MSPGPLALVGSGEYLPAMTAVEAALLEGRPPRYVQLATAAVPDGGEVVQTWHRLGGEAAARVGAEQVILPVSSRRDAEDPAIAEMVRGAGLVYLSGGKPAFLADTLRDSPLWEAIVEAWRGGAALAGCSAGAMAMATWVPSIRHPRAGGTQGFGLLPHVRVIPHFDAFAARIPDLATRFMVGSGDGVTVVGVDELTAIVGGPVEWEVQGAASAWILSREGRTRYPAGSTLTTPTDQP